MRWFGRKRATRAPIGSGAAARRSRRLFVEQCEPRDLLTSVAITSSADNSLFQDNTTGSDGAGTTLFAGVTAGHTGTASPRRALLKFDVAANVPAGAHIDSVTLQLHDVRNASTGQTFSFGVYPLSASWGEGTSQSTGRGAQASANDATWADRFFGPPAQAWNNAGGDFGSVSATSSVSSSGAFYQWSSTQLATDVQAWLNSPGTNFGWLLKGVDESATASAQEFDSRESSTTAFKPTLTVNYSIPNAAPVMAGPAGASVPHGSTLSFTGANQLSVSDSDGGTSTESVNLAVSSGTISLNTTGVTVVSGGSGTGAIKISGTLANLNTALSTLAFAAPISGTSATLTATANDGLANSNTLTTTISLTNVAPAVAGPSSASIAHGGTLNFAGGNTISVSDLDGGSSAESVALSVTSGSLALNAGGVSVIGGSSGSGAVTISGTLANLNTALATLSYTAPLSGASATLNVTANDGAASSNALSTTITLSDVAPSLTGPGSASVARGASLAFTGSKLITLSDTDGGSSTESVALSVTSGTLSLNTSGVNVSSGASGTVAVTISGTLANLNTALATLAYTAPATGTSATLTATANDGSASSTPLTCSITLTSPVNQPPTIDSIADVGYPQDSGQHTVNLAGITAGTGDSQAISVTAVSDDTTLIDTVLVQYTSPSSTGSLTFTPAAGQTGTAKITVTVRDAGLNGTLGDGDDGLVSKSFTVSVLSPDQVNHAPSFLKGNDEGGTDEGGTITVQNWATQISPGPQQESSQTVTFLVTTDDDPLHPLLAATPIVDSSGKLTFTPAANAHGTVHVSVRAHDTGGTLAGGVDTSDAQMFAITITKPHPWHNTAINVDVDGDGQVAPKDLVVVISRLNGFGATAVPDNPPFGPPYYDVDNDLNVAPKDLVLIIIHLNGFGAGEGESTQPTSAAGIQPDAADALLAQFDPLSAIADPLQPRRRFN